MFKKGSKHKVFNYRSDPLICVCSKIFEHIMVNQTNRHLKEMVSLFLINTASERACHVTHSSLTLTMTSTQCFQSRNRLIALWWTSARPWTRCNMVGSSQRSTNVEYEAKTSTRSRTSWEPRPNEWSLKVPPTRSPQSTLGCPKALPQPHPVFAIYEWHW